MTKVKQNGTPVAALEGQPQKARPDIHVEGNKRLSGIVDEFLLTIQHALRVDVVGSLNIKRLHDPGNLPGMEPLTLLEYFDFSLDSDSEFLNWLFPFCAFRLTRENIGPVHTQLVEMLRREIHDLQIQDPKTYANGQ